jgi:hypothetical protein
VTLDVPPTVKAALAERAHQLDTSESQLAAWLLAYALDRAQADPELAAMLDASCVTARALKFPWNLEIPETWTK